MPVGFIDPRVLPDRELEHRVDYSFVKESNRIKALARRVEALDEGVETLEARLKVVAVAFNKRTSPQEQESDGRVDKSDKDQSSKSKESGDNVDEQVIRNLERVVKEGKNIRKPPILIGPGPANRKPKQSLNYEASENDEKSEATQNQIQSKL